MWRQEWEEALTEVAVVCTLLPSHPMQRESHGVVTWCIMCLLSVVKAAISCCSHYVVVADDWIRGHWDCTAIIHLAMFLWLYSTDISMYMYMVV